MKNYKYSCGCSFDVLDDEDLKINFDPIHSPINLECHKTWELISEGNTKGCFQLESRLGKSMSKKLKPENIEQLARDSVDSWDDKCLYQFAVDMIVENFENCDEEEFKSQWHNHYGEDA